MKTLTQKSMLATFLAFSAALPGFGDTAWLSSMDLTLMRQDWGKPQADLSVSKTKLSIGGKTFERGVGTHASSVLWVELGEGTEEFSAFVGIDDSAASAGSVDFKIYGNGKKIWNSGALSKGTAQEVRVPLRGLKTIQLVVDGTLDGIRSDNADWAEARFTFNGTAPKAIRPPEEPRIVLTPKAAAQPRINSARVYGCRPGRPFLYRIPATGERPMKFGADGLPDGLKLDATSGIITGSIARRANYTVTLRALNQHGGASRSFEIRCGDRLALTPTMGWNDWYAHYHDVTDAMMRQAADLMITNGMADAGYDYVNIDDCWMNADKDKNPARNGAFRDEHGNLLPNTYFPNMQKLTDYIHSKGLKAGIYTSPGPKTCGGFAGSYEHEAQDARQFAEWGFDFVKYDWCSYGSVAGKNPNLETMQKPYALMGDLLQQQKRDITFNLCQYGMGAVWKWGEAVHGHSWRTSGDLGYELNRIFAVAIKNCEHRAFQKPGAWNDPDYLQIGYTGLKDNSGAAKPFPLTPNEQYAFMSMWCLMSAPLFYSGDLTRLDEFTLNILCNPEVIEIDQDPLGQCARVVAAEEDTFVMVKDLEDGSKAVGLCNSGEGETTLRAKWSDLEIAGKYEVRDLWRQKNLGIFEAEFNSPVPRHGVILVKLSAVAADSAAQPTR